MLFDPKERQARDEIFENRVNYSLPVRVGYWIDELALQEQNRYLYDYKKDHCQLLIQKTRKMFRNLLKPTNLAIEDPHIYYGRLYQIKSFETTGTTPCGKEIKIPLFLSGILSDKEIDFVQNFVHGCAITASKSKRPSMRNTFMLEGADQSAVLRTGPVNYGEDVYVRILSENGAKLYLQCENLTMDSFGKHLSVRITQNPDIYSRFKILHWKPDLRYETTGTFVHHDAHVIIQHTASGHNLAAEFHQWIPTFFGPECVVTCHTCRDSHRMETAENLWKIVGEKGVDRNFVKEAKGES